MRTGSADLQISAEALGAFIGRLESSREISRPRKLHIHELISMAILYREDGLSFLGERWSYHLGNHTNRQVHANEGLYPKRTPFAGALEAFVRFGSPYAHRARSKRICCFVRR